MKRTISKTGALMVLALFTVSTSALADLRVNFDEGAPKDRFRLENTGACRITEASILLDLSTSAGGLIFDVTGQGAGVEVFQPFEIVEGLNALNAPPDVVDGQKQIRLDVSALEPGEAIAFTIDVDDTLGQRAITVSGQEIDGAMVELEKGGQIRSAAFSPQAVAEIEDADC